jgi:hypothetical protein
LNYTYDAAGNIRTSTNGAVTPQAQFTYGYDAGGRLASVTSSLDSPPNYPSTLFSANSSTTSDCGGSSSVTLTAYDGANQLQYAQMGLVGQGQPAVTSTRCYDTRLRPTFGSDMGAMSTPGVPASTTVTISGAEQSIAGSGAATQATGTIALSYSGTQSLGKFTPLLVGNSITLPGGYHASFVATGTSALVVANALASVLNNASSPVTAVVSAGGSASAASVVLTSRSTGASDNGAISLSLVTTPVRAAAASMSGGGGPTFDTGTVTANINGTTVTTTYGQTSTAQTVAQLLANAISGAGAGVTAVAGSAGAVTVTASQTGAAGDSISVTLSSVTNQPSHFTSASFNGSSGMLSGGMDGTSTPGTIYSYSVAGSGGVSGYAQNGNLLAYKDQLITGSTDYSST